MPVASASTYIPIDRCGYIHQARQIMKIISHMIHPFFHDDLHFRIYQFLFFLYMIMHVCCLHIRSTYSTERGNFFFLCGKTPNFKLRHSYLGQSQKKSFGNFKLVHKVLDNLTLYHLESSNNNTLQCCSKEKKTSFGCRIYW